MTTPLQKKRTKITLLVAILFLVYLLAVPFISIFMYMVADSYLASIGGGEGSLLFIIMFVLVVLSVLLWYCLLLRAKLKLDVEIGATERVAALMPSIEKFQKLFENSPVPYVTLDEKGAI